MINIIANKEVYILREKVLNILEEQGFEVNPIIKIQNNNKEYLRYIQQNSRLEQINEHKNFLIKNFDFIKKYAKNGSEINPEKIKLELLEINKNTLEERIFKWWNFIWWSIPYQRPYGRQMRFLLWDKTHNMPFGLIYLQSPILRMSIRDKALKIPIGELDEWINRSMKAQRVGALPPYNELIGGKMVALALVSNEIRKNYKDKYSNYRTIIKNRVLSPELLFITTTSAFGRSSIYNRLKYKNELIAECLGYTKGSGSFHIPNKLYEEIINFLVLKGINVNRSFGFGPSRKLKIISKGLKYLGLPNFEYHGIKREFYLFPLVKNLSGVIQLKEDPIWNNHSFKDLQIYWKNRWCLSRADRTKKWRLYKKDSYFKKIEELLKEN